jgi:hypothetical protein
MPRRGDGDAEARIGAARAACLALRPDASTGQTAAEVRSVSGLLVGVRVLTAR